MPNNGQGNARTVGASNGQMSLNESTAELHDATPGSGAAKKLPEGPFASSSLPGRDRMGELLGADGAEGNDDSNDRKAVLPTSQDPEKVVRRESSGSQQTSASAPPLPGPILTHDTKETVLCIQPSAGQQAPAPTSPPIAPARTYPEGGLTAWLVVFGAFCGMFSAFGLLNTLGVLQAYLITHQLAGYSTSAVGWIFSIYVFMAFFGGVQIGPIFDKRGPKELVTLGGLSLVGGMLGLANATEYWHFILAMSIAAGLGTSLIFTPSISSIAHWFCVRRGYATGLAATGGSVGGVIFPLVLPVLFARLGWAWTLRVLALIFAVFVSVAVILLKARIAPRQQHSATEEDISQDSEEAEDETPRHGSPIASSKKHDSIWIDPLIFLNLQFSLTTAGVFFIEWGLFVPLTYLSSWAIETGVDNISPLANPATITITNPFPYQLLAILNAASFFGRWLPGVLADKIGRFNAMSLATGLALVVLLTLWLPSSLPFTGAEGSVALAILFALGFGFASGSGISLSSVCVGELCAVEEYGRYYATCYTVVSFGCLTGVPIAGAIVGVNGGEYWGLVLFTAGCYVGGLVCFVAVRVLRGGWRWRVVC